MLTGGILAGFYSRCIADVSKMGKFTKQRPIDDIIARQKGKIEIVNGWYCQNTNCPNRALQPFPNSKMYYWNSRHLKVCESCKDTEFETVRNDKLV